MLTSWLLRIIGVPYLRSSRVEHGLLINFGVPKFEIKKYALSRIGEGRRPGGLIGGILLLFASLAPFRGMFHLVAYHGNWYLLALNSVAGRIETFALSRCRSIEGSGQHFARPVGFHAPAFFKDALGISQADKPWKVRLLFAREVATYIRERVWHTSQALRQRRDGALELRLQTSSRKELTRWILSWMPHVKVLAPRQLRDRVRQRMRQGLDRCSSVSGHASQKRMRALRCGSLRAVRS